MKFVPNIAVNFNGLWWWLLSIRESVGGGRFYLGDVEYWMDETEFVREA